MDNYLDFVGTAFNMMMTGSLGYGAVSKGANKALVDNSRITQLYIIQFLNYALNIFKWEDLPEELENEVRWIQMNLILNGCICFYRDEKLGGKILALKVLAGKGYNAYGNLTSWDGATATNEVYRDLNPKNSVIIYSNITRTPYIGLLIHEYARRIADVQRTMDIRLNNHKMPLFYVGDKNVIGSIKSIFKRIVSNEECVVENKTMANAGLGAMQYQNDVSFLHKELQELKRDYINELFAFMGVNFNPSDNKKERLITNEVNSNNEQVFLAREIMQNTIEDGIKQFNKMFDQNTSIKYFMDDRVTYDTEVVEEGTEVIANGY